MNPAQQFHLLGRKQLAIQEGVDLLRQVQQELARTRRGGDAWGTIAVIANVTLIPLNAIVNAFELKTAQTVYQALVRELYGKFAKSGSRIDGHAKTALGLLKQGIVMELKRKALTQYVPGVNILVGLAEDSLAAWQVVQMVDAGSREVAAQADALNRKIDAAIRQLLQLGIQRADLLGRMQLQARTA